jgi:hypothetical protein
VARLPYLPIDWVKKVRDPKNKWGEITKSRLSGISVFKNEWGQIAAALKI